MGKGTIVDQLKHGLDLSNARAKGVAHRVANASNHQVASFEEALRGTGGGEGAPVDLDAEMVRLADEQLRFETMSRVLSRTYGQIRSTLRSQ